MSRLRGVAFCLAAGLIVSGCSGGKDDPAPGNAQPTAVVTPTPPASASIAGTPAQAASAIPATPSGTSTPPATAPPLPAVAATPGRGPVGSKVVIGGTGFHDPMWQTLVNGGGYGVFLTRFFRDEGGGGCELIARSETVAEFKDGRLTAEFEVPDSGGCFQGDGREHEVTPGTYYIGVGCHACHLGEFEVTAE